jgi:hypothetical protein
VYPNADNNALAKMGIRTEVQDALYRALGIPANKSRVAVRLQQTGE